MSLRLAPLSLVLLVLLSACREPKVSSYRVPKETPEPLPPILTGALPANSTPAAANSGNMASTAVPTASGEGLAWTAPASWRVKPASAMRKGSYSVPGADGTEADLSITAFPGDVGGALANVNRWRGQLELAPLAESDLESALTHLDIDSLHADVVEFASASSAKSQRMIGAIVPFEGATWFFKLTGPDALVAHEKPAFLNFLKTIKASAPVQR
ncbi:MAG: hypothetical protein ABIZ04_17610 [Opitutus sp.]